jgi:signal transduction histidine kinase
MRIPHRYNLLFLGAVLLPSVLVIALGVRMIRQEDELAEKRVREDKAHAINFVRQDLLNRLEGHKLRAVSGSVTPRDTDVALVARVESGRLVLPWEGRTSTAGALLTQLRDPAHARAVLLRTNASVTDEYGVPMSVYAGRRLAAGASVPLRLEILDRMAAVLNDTALSPMAAHMIAEVCERLGAAKLRDTAASRAREGEQAEPLAEEIPSFDSGRGGPVWSLTGSWLVGITGRAGDRQRTLVAVRAWPVLSSVQLPASLRWSLGEDGEALGEGLPGVRLVTASQEGSASPRPRQIFYLSGLLLVIALTAFAAYLLHRDVRRETHLAALRSQFVSSVSHELRTPIATIRAFAELIDMGRVRGEREKADYVKSILGESERLSRLVEGVLEFSRIEQGKRVYRLRPVALWEVLQSAARALEYPLAQGNFELSIAADEDVPAVPADPEALEQAVINLLGNAMKYSGESRAIDLTLTREGNQAAIRVRDRGIGIPIEDHGRIFERFYRTAETGVRQIPGTGLGLALVDHIVKAHGGRVAVESQPGEGSTFSILLPIPMPT